MLFMYNNTTITVSSRIKKKLLETNLSLEQYLDVYIKTTSVLSANDNSSKIYDFYHQ